jgi:hypothetical protein
MSNNIFPWDRKNIERPQTKTTNELQIDSANRLARLETMMCEINSKLELILDTMTKPQQPEAEAKAVVVQAKVEEPRRTTGISAIAQINKWAEGHDGGMRMLKQRAKAGFVTATIIEKSAHADSSHKYTHRLNLNDKLVSRYYHPTIFGITEAREVVAYLESLGVKVKTNNLI